MTGDMGTGARLPREQSLAPFPLPLPTREPLAQLLQTESLEGGEEDRCDECQAEGEARQGCLIRTPAAAARPPQGGTCRHRALGPGQAPTAQGHSPPAQWSRGRPSARPSARPAPQIEGDRYRHQGTVTLRHQRRSELLHPLVTEHLPKGRGGHRRAAGRAFTAAVPHSQHSLFTGPGEWGHAHRQGLALTHAADLRSAWGPWGRVRDRGPGMPGLAGSPGPLASQPALHSQGGQDRRHASSRIPGDALAPGTYQHPQAVLQICSDMVRGQMEARYFLCCPLPEVTC